MSAALWFFFWDDADWGGAPPAPAPAPASASDSGSGGGGRRKKKNAPYAPAPDDFWEVREAYLKSLLAKHESEPQPAPKPPPNDAAAARPRVTYSVLPRLLAERSVAISALRLTENLSQLEAAGARLIELNLAIAEAKRLHLEHMLEEVRARRIRKLRRNKRKAVLLTAAQLLLKILFPAHR